VTEPQKYQYGKKKEFYRIDLNELISIIKKCVEFITTSTCEKCKKNMNIDKIEKHAGKCRNCCNYDKSKMVIVS
jgi:uncharacterized protein YqgV (UPF0045/DUF77 family)